MAEHGIGEEEILARQAEGKRMADRPQSLLPNFRRSRASSSVGETIFNALTGAAAGLQAGRGVAQLGSPALSALTGLAGGMQAPTFVDLQAQRDAALAQAQMQQIQMASIDEVSPDLVAKHRELSGLPTGLVHQILPMLSRYDSLEQQLSIFNKRESGKDTRFDESQAATKEEREYKHRERRNAERTSIVSRFNSDLSVRRAQQSIDAAGVIRELAQSGNPVANSAIPTYMARASGEVGALSEADKAPFGGSRAILSRLEAALKQAVNGKMTEDNARFIIDLSNIIEKRANANLDNLSRLRARQYSKSSDFLNEEDIFSSLRPESITGGGMAGAASGSPRDSGTVRMQTPDGKIWNIPANKAADAEKRGARRL